MRVVMGVEGCQKGERKRVTAGADGSGLGVRAHLAIALAAALPR